MAERRRYPLGEHEADRIVSRSGRALSELTMENIRSGLVDADDLSIHPETLRAQAEIAEQAGFAQLAANLRRYGQPEDYTARAHVD